MFTDGLLENEGVEGKTLGIRALRKMLAAQSQPASLKEQLLRTVEATWGAAPMADDFSFLIARRADEQTA